jgi:adenosylmethionine-8-amino-7-oxononanoate aminotransferase
MPDWLTSGYPHIWLPYAQMQTTAMPLPVVGAQGCEIVLEDGTKLLDGISSWWSMCHGYQHPQIVEAMQTQAAELSHVMFAGLAHAPAYTLAQKLVAMAPNNTSRTSERADPGSCDETPDDLRPPACVEQLNRVFFADSGSIAVEVALKMALQYWANLGRANKTKIIGFNNGYHGDTFGAMSVSSRGGFHKAYDGMTSLQYHLDIPNDEYGMAEFEAMVKEIHGNVAALIIEPLVQGAGGFKFHSADILSEIRRICREYDILFIADEIMTGFHRTGSRFACDEAGITPDILCIGKALTGGHINLGATLASEEIFNAFLSDDLGKALMHGPTFMANPLACAAALASLALFDAQDYAAKTEAIEAQLQRDLEPLRGLRGVKDVRIKGAIGVVQIDANQQDMFALRPEFTKRGVWLRPFSDCVYILPPLVVSKGELSKLTQAVAEVVTDWSNTKE